MSTSFDQRFCELLEYHLTKAFSNADEAELRRFWCDGINLPEESEIAAKSINDTRKIRTKAWIGNNGPDEYETIITFGSKSLSRYARDLNIDECLPPATENGWYLIDTQKKTLEIQLL